MKKKKIYIKIISQTIINLKMLLPINGIKTESITGKDSLIFTIIYRKIR